MDVITASEYSAFALLHQGELNTKTTAYSFHEAADKIILLAEKIKAERLTVSMTSGEHDIDRRF